MTYGGDKPMGEACRRCFVTGRVQGVFFRASAREQGEVLGLRVKARNLPDGRVEVLARGHEAALDRLCEWLRTGPPLARVEQVVCAPVDEETWTEFSVHSSQFPAPSAESEVSSPDSRVRSPASRITGCGTEN